jgi:hypothetical protein
VYTCNVRITKPGIKIEPRDKDKPVYLLGNDGPAITVDLKEKEHFVVIKKILLAHSGINIVAKFREVQMAGASDEGDIKKANAKFISEFDINRDMNTAILVKRGGLILRNCLISLRSLPKNLNTKIPCFVSLPDSRVNIVNCEFMGNENS